MSEQIDAETMKRLKKWSDARGYPIEDLQKKFLDHKAELQKLHPGKAESFYLARARFLVYKDIKTRGMIRAKPVDGVFFGIFPAWDINRGARALAIETFRTNPDKAVREGWTDASGTPLDMKREMGPPGSNRPNPNYGKPLLPMHLARSVAASRPAEGGDIKMTIITHIGDQALRMPPLGKSVRMLLNFRSEDDNKRLYNTSVATKYSPIDMAEFPDLSEAFICNYLLQAPDDFRPTLGNLYDWHQAHANDIRRLAIVEADVTYVRRTPTSTGNFIMTIEDESLMDLEAEGTTVFVPGALGAQLNFAPGSRVVVLGGTSVGPGYDRETRTVDNSVQRTIMNACGVWAIPEFRIPLEEETILGSDVDESVTV